MRCNRTRFSEVMGSSEIGAQGCRTYGFKSLTAGAGSGPEFQGRFFSEPPMGGSDIADGAWPQDPVSTELVRALPEDFCLRRLSLR